MAERLFHLVVPAAWQARPGAEWAPPSLESEGFLHLSFASQLQGSVDLHLGREEAVWLLEVDGERLAADLKLEASRGGALFPHLYRALQPDDVLRWWKLCRASANSWRLPALAPVANEDEPQGALGAP